MKIDKWIMAQFLLVAGIVALLFWKAPLDDAISTSLSIVVTVVVILFMRQKYPERYQKDERTVKVSGYAASWSWLVTLILVTLFFWIEYLSIIELEASTVILSVFATQVLSILAFRWYFARRGGL